ncbi:unnamed protein product [Didymodactylos carnosus]|uniref:Xylulose kinase n=1 Tax=Didymodactylos carnosus TaxID=1234261 RepID=A0A815IS90_9BILA|nr:unnamed protein product [Didymodactylos carnosus]CAF4254503.1 unnamed protein product [Didymodactylos carnosus]
MSSKSTKNLYLGLDLSTQQFKGVVIDEELNVVAEDSVSFNDKTLLKNYVLPNGFIVDKNDPDCITTPVLVWIEAFDVLLQKLRDQKTFDFKNIVGISGCGQQHGSVYWAENACENGLKRLKQHSSSNDDDHGEIVVEKLRQLPKNLFLIDYLKECFSRANSPIWMDSSTTKYCRLLEERLGGSQKLFEITGSKAYERFTGSQIMKFQTESNDLYLKTERIQLVSNFVSTLLLGEYTSVDYSDGSGMNLFDIINLKWSQECLDACAPDLLSKLYHELVHPLTILGPIAIYFVDRYGFDPDCKVIAFTGDNPSSYYALASDPETIVISLGTSDTVIASVKASQAPKEAFDGHLFVNPMKKNDNDNLLMLLLCFKNGSLVRERVKEEITQKDWQQMSELLCHSPPSNHGYIGMFFDDQEILPHNIQGRFYFDAHGVQVKDLEPSCKARALLEGQCLAKRLYLQRANIDLANVKRIVITGGGSVNIDLLQILADTFGKPVHAAFAPNSACLGGAYRAIDAIKDHNKSITSTIQWLIAAQPRSEFVQVYDEMLVRYADLENQLTNQHQQASHNQKTHHHHSAANNLGLQATKNHH